MKRITCIGLLALSACTTAKPEKVSAAEAFGKAVAPGPSGPAADPAETVPMNTTMSPERFIKQFKRPLECEQSARSLQRSAPDRAWAYLRACVGRGGFTQLSSILDNWTNDLRNRPDGPVVIASILAARGGHITSDLQLLQNKRLPVFDLKSAVTQPGTYKGKYVVFVGKVGKMKEAKGKVELALYEQSVSTGDGGRFMPTGPAYYQSSESSGAYAARGSSSRHGGFSYGAAGASSSSSLGVSGHIEQGARGDVFEETGQEIIAQLTNADPFLSTEKQFLFLVKFNSAKTSDTSADEEDTSEEPSKLALVSLVSYHDIGSQYGWGATQ
jgi:hypothetical protein